MTRRFVTASLTLAFAATCCLGCSGGNTITKGTTPVTALAPSEPTYYPGGESSRPPNPKDLIKDKMPQKPGKK